MTYHERVLALRAESKRTAFDFRFEDLFSKEEWLSMSLAERQKAEKAFRHEVKNMDDVRMPFSSVHDAQVKLYKYILITALNVILNKLKMKDSNIISFIYSRHDRILYVNLVGNRFKNNISMTKATSNIGRGF